MPVLASAVGSKSGPNEFEVTDRRLLGNDDDCRGGSQHEPAPVNGTLTEIGQP